MSEPTTTTTTAAPATTTTSAPAAPSTTSTAPVTATPSDWTAGLPELDRGYVQNKGWKGPQDVLSSYQNMEKFHGVPETNLLKIPTKDDDKDGWAKIYDRLGRPSKPEEYGLKGQDGKMTDLQKWASDVFHEAGLTRKQAEAVVSKWDAQNAAVTETKTKEFQMKIAAEQDGLKKEWGLAYDQSIKQAQMAAKSFGVGAEEIEAMERSMGYTKVMKFFQNVGSKLGESSFVSGGKDSGFGALSPEAAKAKVHALKSDTDFIKRFQNGDSSAVEEISRLTKFSNPEYS